MTIQAMHDMKRELQQLRDEIKLQIHLGTAEAKQKWHEIQPQIDQFEKRAERATETITDEVRESYAQLRSAMHRVRAELDPKRRS
jgi:hypothetical protein